MPLSPQDALIYLMVIAASSDSSMNEVELQRIETLVGQLPVFDSSDRAGLSRVANNCVDLINSSSDIEGVLDMAIGAIPSRLQDTAYALVVEIAAADLTLPQEELRFLEMIRDKLDLDRLVTAAIEVAARARYRHA
jgi:tellurite resistance protein